MNPTKNQTNGHDQYADSLFRPGASVSNQRVIARRSKSRGRQAVNVDRDAAIRGAAAKGVKHSDLAAQHGISEVRVWQIINQWSPAAAKARKKQKKLAQQAQISAAEIIEGMSQRRGRKPTVDYSRIVADRAKGLTLREIAALHGVSFERVRQIIYEQKKLKAERDSKLVALIAEPAAKESAYQIKVATRNAEIAKERSAGIPVSEIADRYGISQNRVWDVINSLSYAAASISQEPSVDMPAAAHHEKREEDRFMKIEAMLDTLVKTINQHADDGNADQKRIAALEARIADQESEIKLLWKRLDGINHELDDIEDALPPPKPKSAWAFWKRG